MQKLLKALEVTHGTHQAAFRDREDYSGERSSLDYNFGGKVAGHRISKDKTLKRL
jgi:hypothetical protein